MVIIFTSPSCSSCRKAKIWFIEHDIPFIERNISLEPLTDNEIKRMFQMTLNGTYEIISTRSKVYQEMEVNIDQISMGNLFELIKKEPGLLKKPIIFDDRRLQVGYSEDEIRKFLPRTQRSYQLHKALRLVTHD